MSPILTVDPPELIEGSPPLTAVPEVCASTVSAAW
eukprot:CAMPEP_0114270228 /NCGR_PEP_ID=MMETSP0058-20121206/27113_1 /TAXON_ID=36894 /ORGANISM="Pyramimonas parkeae, CCMP726" /LENGTH=34 /DNA_ID= /DNA_START= /DNA_END= /DNA_ORIENTATION=